MNERPCWRRNGVWGRERPRCPRLEEVIHCRNCEEYIRPGRELLERLARAHPPPAPAPQDEAPPPQRSPAQLVFRVNGNWLALPGTLILQVEASTVPRPLPHQQRTTLRGLVNVGGRLLVCLSLTDTLGIPRLPPQMDDPARGIFERLVAVEGGGLRFAFRAGEVRGLYRCAEADLQPLGPEDAALRAFARGVWSVTVRPGETVRCVLLDPDRTLARIRECIA